MQLNRTRIIRPKFRTLGSIPRPSQPHFTITSGAAEKKKKKAIYYLFLNKLIFLFSAVVHRRIAGNIELFRRMKFLKPVTFYKEVFKDILMKNASKHGRLLGLDVRFKYVSLAVSDSKNLTAVPLRGLHTQETNMTSMADIFQSLISEHNLVCLVVGTPYTGHCDAKPFLEQTQIFIDNLCKTGKLEGFKYTFWDNTIGSKNSEFVLEQHVKFMLEHLNQPQKMSKKIMVKCRAVSALQGFLDCTNKMVAENCD